MSKAPSKEMQAFVDEIRKPRGRTVLEEKTLIDARSPMRSGALRDPASFRRTARSSCRLNTAAAILRRRRSSAVSPSYPLLTYWYFHLPNFVLAALMYTLLGRVLLGADRRAGLVELHLALLLPHHRSVRRARRAGDAEGRGAGGRLAVRRRLAVLAARRPALSVPVAGRSPAHELSRAMDRNLLLHRHRLLRHDQRPVQSGLAAVRAASTCKILAPALLFGSVSLTLMFVVADGLDRHHHPRRHSGRDLRALRRRQGRLDRGLAVDLAGRHRRF